MKSPHSLPTAIPRATTDSAIADPHAAFHGASRSAIRSAICGPVFQALVLTADRYSCSNFLLAPANWHELCHLDWLNRNLGSKRSRHRPSGQDVGSKRSLGSDQRRGNGLGRQIEGFPSICLFRSTHSLLNVSSSATPLFAPHAPKPQRPIRSSVQNRIAAKRYTVQ